MDLFWLKRCCPSFADPASGVAPHSPTPHQDKQCEENAKPPPKKNASAGVGDSVWTEFLLGDVAWEKLQEHFNGEWPEFLVNLPLASFPLN